ncbi:Protein (Secreted)corresponding to a gene involved in the response to chromate [Cupriavidus neocaledonicus]|uniref:Protein (Secreted)corresponding to a gene involved in the response to chromate n=1 Tax=Cupriavidus neocaledonicus TaxID=1040979 RepID=A0A375H8W7_9BURK|nr:Protein (Secreted)corresponding to a gene involved in the response to chromate [Cupriavidus neocaledonicus]
MAQDVFRHLNASEVKKTIAGKVVTDGPHWADRFAPDGTVESVMQGQLQKGRWSVRGNNLCLAYPGAKAEECFEVWRYGRIIEYRRDGVLEAQGTLVNQ